MDGNEAVGPDELALWGWTATELAAAIADGEVSSREVVEAHLRRIAEVNPRLNAITVEMADQALLDADAADAAPDEERGPLHGVPFTTKENIDQFGYATTQAVAALADARPGRDAVTVERMRAAGAVPIGRTNMPEFGLRVSTDNAFRGLTRNPWHPDHTAGGSSGGEGSAIASGMSPMGLGNDIGGSIRNPALCCGVAGLKPGFGRIPRVADLPPQDPGIGAQLMAVEGPLARSVADLSVLLEMLSGPSERDPRVVDRSTERIDTPRRAGVVRSVPGTEVGPGALAAVDAAAEALATAGWEVVEVEAPDLERLREVWAAMIAFDIRIGLPVFETVMGPDELELLRALVARCDELAMPDSVIFTERFRLQRMWSAMFVDTPVVVGPGWTSPPFRHGEDVVPGRQMEVLEHRLGFVVPGNVLGLPVLAVTTGTHDGLPVGVQVYADHHREGRCLLAGADIEASVGVRRPIDPTWD